MSAPTAAARRVGYLFAVTITALVWFALTAWPSWQRVGIFTADFSRVLPVVELSMLATILAYLAYAVHDVPWLRTVGAVVTTGAGLAALVAVWRVFPFTVAGSGWGATLRVALVFAMVGTLLDLLVQFAAFLRARR